MGFSSSLQGTSSHDAILQRVDSELRLLENMKRCLTARVKADREYAIGKFRQIVKICFLLTELLTFLKLIFEFGFQKVHENLFTFHLI